MAEAVAAVEIAMGTAPSSSAEQEVEPNEEEQPRKSKKRCFACNRRAGLTGFKCRCGDLFCAQHRYSDMHDCSFDYKTAGRLAILKANPVVKAPEIVGKMGPVQEPSTTEFSSSNLTWFKV